MSCRSPSGYRRHAQVRREPHRRSVRASRDTALLAEIERGSLQVYGADKASATACIGCTVRAEAGSLREVLP